MNQRIELSRNRFSSSVLVAVWLLSLVTPLGCRHGDRRPATEPVTADAVRAIWVTRWDYKSASDIGRLMRNCKDAGFNTVLFQVRGNGTAFYRSALEPWADELGGRDPGFDPLAVACREAHRQGMQLQAWVNVMPGWRGKQRPSNPVQLYNAHPDWFLRDARGRRQPLGWYSSLNPCYPEVRRYLVAVLREIVAGYPVDGLHMDYIRFPNEWNDAYPKGASVPDYPRDPRTLAMFRRATRATPDSDPAGWTTWRTQQVTELVRGVRAMMAQTAPGMVLTAAVSADPAAARRAHFQDARQWVAQGLVDAVFPMNYASDAKTFTKRLAYWKEPSSKVRVVMGIMFDKRDGPTVLAQIRAARQTGGDFAAFAYNSLFERFSPSGRPVFDAQSDQRSALRRAVIPHVRKMATGRLASTR